jgi:FkbM family methyltransferase
LHDRLGLRLLLDPSSLVDRCVIDDGTWEPEQTAFFIGLTKRLLLKAPVVFLDLGSYWGLYSLLAMKAGVRRVFTFDADRHNFSQLQAQIFLNDATEVVKPFNKAISSEAATLTFWDSRAHPDKNRAGAGVVPVELGLPTYDVEAIAIDEFLPMQGETIMIKLDVEGHEKHALKGLAKTIAQNRVVIQVEMFNERVDEIRAVLDTFDLREINAIYPDRYYTNIPADVLGV